MQSRSLRLILAFGITASLTLPTLAQNPAPQPKNQPANATASKPAATFHVYSRAVTLDVVVKDHNLQHLSGLKPEDFQIFEQTPSVSRERSTQKIASFREVHAADLTGHAANLEFPPGFISNLVSMPKDPVPPTIILIDGLNTDVKDQAQIHVQMLRMLQKLPPSVPVSVYLFGSGITMLQDFTTDPHLLQAALGKSLSTAGIGLSRVDPRDDQMSPGVMMSDLASSGSSQSANDSQTKDMTGAVSNWDMQIYSSNMDNRVLRTIDAMTYIALHVSGYQGRKNILWISSSFPFAMDPFPGALGNYSTRMYTPLLAKLSNMLNEAKIAVYPIDPSGISSAVPSDYEGTLTSRFGGNVTGPAVQATLSREDDIAFQAKETMRTLAEGTGGQVCVGDNDLADCVQKAIDDGSQYYEITYYSNSTDWNGQYRKIQIETRQPHLNLAYRQGYYATPQGGISPVDQKAGILYACNSTLSATGIFITARNVPAEVPGRNDFSLSINAEALTFTQLSDGNYRTNAMIAVCTYNEKGWAKVVMRYPIRESYDADQYRELLRIGALRQSIYIPGAMPPTARLVVQDIPSGKIGSILIKASDLVENQPKPETKTN